MAVGAGRPILLKPFRRLVEEQAGDQQIGRHPPEVGVTPLEVVEGEAVGVNDLTGQAGPDEVVGLLPAVVREPRGRCRRDLEQRGVHRLMVGSEVKLVSARPEAAERIQVVMNFVVV